MKKFFYSFYLLFLFSLQVNAQASLDSGLVAYYPFTGNAGDSSVNNNNPIFNNATLTNDRFGNSSSAYYFNGNGQYMKIANHPTINFNNKMSICLWMKPMGYYKGKCYNNLLISKGITDASWGNQGNYSIRFADYVNGCNSNADTTKEYLFGPFGGVCTNQNIQTNRWYFVVFSTDGVTSKTFINNKLSHVGSHPFGSTFTNQHDLRFGAWGDTTQYPYWFNGVLDDIRIYNRALDDDEVSLLYKTSPYPTINGNVFVDVNNNGVFDSTDFYKPNTKIATSDGGFAITNFQGNYNVVTDTLGAYSTTIAPTSLYNATPTGYSYNFNSYDTLVDGDFRLENTTTNFDSVRIRMIPLFNAARPGFDYPVSVSYFNDGNTFLNNTSLTINYDSSKLNFISASNNLIVNNGNSLTIPLFNFAPGDQELLGLYFKVKTTAVLGDTLKQLCTIASSVSASDDFWTIIRGSYDPNDKNATPLLTPTEANNGKYIDYIVRFENTGTDTAFNIFITDEISSLLNVNSIEVTTSSHPVNVNVNDRKVTFNFNDIKLPPTITDKIKSHGYVSFRIKTNKNLIHGTDISNTAAIYFDFNLPIITNTAITKIRVPAVLPLKITNYNIALLNNKSVSNIWNTSNETNVSHFNVQRSFNGFDFTTIGQIKAKNKTNNEYQFIDNSPQLTVDSKPLTFFYRIASIENDGKINYSETRILNFTNNSSYSVFPNPSRNELYISNKSNQISNVKMTDLFGKTISILKITKTTEKFDVSSLPSGMYILNFDNGEKIKFIKQ